MERYVPILAVLFAFLGWYSAPGSGKAQYVRLLDVLLYGPFLLYLSYRAPGPYTFSEAEKIFLLFLGVTTITYNLRNYVEIEKEKNKVK
jgi:hypothetical protein